MDPLEQILEPQTARAREQKVFGLVTARVRSIEDGGTCLLDYLSMGADEPSAPARVMMPMAGSGRGMHFLPEPGDEVVVGFHEGDTNQPIVLGGVWNDRSRSPSQAKASPDNHVRTVVSRSGHELTFDDTPGAEKVVLKSKGGHELTMDDRPGLGKVMLKTAGGASLTLSDSPPGGVTLTSASGASVELSDAGGTARVAAPTGLTLASAVVTIQAAQLNITTPMMLLTIAGQPLGLHVHAPPLPPPAPSAFTGPVVGA